MTTFKELRKKTGLRQEDIAADLNVTQSAVSQWERGIAKPKMDQLLTLAKLFSCPVETVISACTIGGENRA